MSQNNYTAKIQAQKTVLDKAKEARTVALTNEQQLKRQQSEQEKECRTLGVEPENLETKITDLDWSIIVNIITGDFLAPDQFKESNNDAVNKQFESEIESKGYDVEKLKETIKGIIDLAKQEQDKEERKRIIASVKELNPEQFRVDN